MAGDSSHLRCWVAIGRGVGLDVVVVVDAGLDTGAASAWGVAGHGVLLVTLIEAGKGAGQRSLALTAMFLGAVAFFEGAALAKAIADRSAFLGPGLEGLGLGVHCHGDSGVV